MIKCFMSEVKRVSIDKVCWKSKMKYLYYISATNVWDNVQDYFNINYMANNKQKKNPMETVYNHISYSNIFQNPNNALSTKKS